jgi:anti-sigma B factor antagonist
MAILIERLDARQPDYGRQTHPNGDRPPAARVSSAVQSVPSLLFRPPDRTVVGAEVRTFGVRGELDVATSELLHEVLSRALEDGCRAVVLDLSKLDFIDASGLSAIAGSARCFAVLGGGLSLRSPSTMLRRLLRMTDLDRLVSIEREERMGTDALVGAGSMSTVSL